MPCCTSPVLCHPSLTTYWSGSNSKMEVSANREMIWAEDTAVLWHRKVQDYSFKSGSPSAAWDGAHSWAVFQRFLMDCAYAVEPPGRAMPLKLSQSQALRALVWLFCLFPAIPWLPSFTHWPAESLGNFPKNFLLTIWNCILKRQEIPFRKKLL